jgi:phosphoglycolate phosphatase
MKKIKGVLFDFDFTLADSSKGVIECVNYALERLKFKRVPAEEIIKTIGFSLEQTLVKILGEKHINKSEEFKNHFIKRADEIMAEYTTLISEVPYVTKLLNKSGLKLGIVSTKFRYRIENILLRENLLDFFEVIIGGEDVQELKPHPSGLFLAVRTLNLELSDVVYVGDSIIDSETAHRAGIFFIAVLSGVTPEKSFKQSQVNFFIESISNLPNLLLLK